MRHSPRKGVIVPKKDSVLTRFIDGVRTDWRDAIAQPYRRGAGMWFDRVWIVGFLPLVGLLNLTVGVVVLANGRPTGWLNVGLFFFILLMARLNLSTSAVDNRSRRYYASEMARITENTLRTLQARREMWEREDRRARGEYGVTLDPPTDLGKRGDR